PAGEEARARLPAALAAAGFGFALFDPQDRLRLANPWFEQAYGVRASAAPTWEAMMRGCHASRRGLIIDTPDIDGWIARVRAKYRRTPVRTFESDLADGRWVWVTETLQPDGWLTMSVADVSPLKATESVLRHARDEAVRISMRDPLTDLYNRRYIMAHLGDMLAGSRAMRWPLALAMIDIDHFKRINDTAGHDVGDAVLCHFACHVQEQLRPMDAVGRIGGEEFLLVLANTGLDGATQILARMRRLIAESLEAAHQPVPAYTFSAGVAVATAEDSVDSLFRRADQALYRAKRDGRNRDWALRSLSMRM
ncbi:MAG TPA: diguanylate cyclase, partial [Albitalea sp.]